MRHKYTQEEREHQKEIGNRIKFEVQQLKTFSVSDLADLLDKENENSIRNKWNVNNTCFCDRELERIAEKYGLRSEYLKCHDDYRTTEDLYACVNKSPDKNISNPEGRSFLNSMGFSIVHTLLALLPFQTVIDHFGQIIKCATRPCARNLEMAFPEIERRFNREQLLADHPLSFVFVELEKPFDKKENINNGVVEKAYSVLGIKTYYHIIYRIQVGSTCRYATQEGFNAFVNSFKSLAYNLACDELPKHSKESTFLTNMLWF